MTNEIMEAYMEDTKGRKYHQNIITKAKQDITPTASEVTTFKYDRPILYKEFIKLTPELRKFYLTHIFGRFKIGRKHLAEAMQVSLNTLGWQCHFLNVKTKRILKEDPKSLEDFWRWWNNPIKNFEAIEIKSDEDLTEYFDEYPLPESNESDTVVEDDNNSVDDSKHINNMNVSDFSITLTGIKQIADISVLLDFINEGYEITVTAKKI